MSDGGKGSGPRPFSVSYDTFSQNFDSIFRKNDMAQTKCGCGRSPTGFCIGWHKMSEAKFQEALINYNNAAQQMNRPIFEPVVKKVVKK